jgi:hypothetical protein
VPFVPAFGGAVTVNNKVAVAFEHPPDPDTIYVIVDVPAIKPEIAPVDASIVATVGVPLLHVPPVIVELNDEVPPTHIVCVPDKVPALNGGQFTAVQLPIPDVKQVPAPPIGVTLIVTASFGVNPFTE